MQPLRWAGNEKIEKELNFNVIKRENVPTITKAGRRTHAHYYTLNLSPQLLITIKIPLQHVRSLMNH